MEDMIMSTKAIRFLDGHEVTRLFHDADNVSLTAGIATDSAGILFRKGKTTRAKLNGIVQFG